MEVEDDVLSSTTNGHGGFDVPGRGDEAGNMGPAIAGPDNDPAIPMAPRKTFKEYARLHQVMRSVALFHNYTERLLNSIINLMYEYHASAGEVIYAQGDRGRHFYVIDSGTFDVIRDGQLTKQLTSEDCFGHAGLLYECKREATVQAKLPGRLWSLDGELFHRFVTRHARERDRWLQQVLSETLPFDSLTTVDEDDLKRLRGELCARSYEAGRIMFRQGDVVDGLYLVEHGIVQMTSTKELGRLETAVRGDFFDTNVWQEWRPLMTMTTTTTTSPATATTTRRTTTAAAATTTPATSTVTHRDSTAVALVDSTCSFIAADVLEAVLGPDWAMRLAKPRNEPEQRKGAMSSLRRIMQHYFGTTLPSRLQPTGVTRKHYYYY